MPRTLAIETSGRIGSIALLDDDGLLASEQFQHGLANAALILPKIDSLIRKQHWTPGDIEHIYVSAGPGSFTGLRIGITLAKTMAFVTGAKLVAVPSVNVLVENAPSDAQHAIIVLDAKREQIFAAQFSRQKDVWKANEPAHVDRLDAMLARSPRPVHLIGEGIPHHRHFIDANDESVIVTPERCWRARAEAVAQIGLEMALRGELIEPIALLPIYIRKPEAEEKYDRHHPR